MEIYVQILITVVLILPALFQDMKNGIIPECCTLPRACHDWRFNLSLCCRNAGIR